jgi:hypothetical protein
MANRLVPRHIGRSYAPYGACHDCVLCIRQSISGHKETKRKCTRCGIFLDTTSMNFQYNKTDILNQVLLSESWRKDRQQWNTYYKERVMGKTSSPL